MTEIQARYNSFLHTGSPNANGFATWNVAGTDNVNAINLGAPGMATVGVAWGYHPRARLVAAGVVRRAGHGEVDFAVPYLREYLREHAATGELEARNLRDSPRGGRRD